MSDLYAVSATKPDGTIVTHFFDKGMTESLLQQGWRIATQPEIDRVVKNLSTDPALRAPAKFRSAPVKSRVPSGSFLKV